jgi:carboxyl-terminal processing protease
MTPEAMAYLTEALDYIQEYSVRREHIDWQALRQEVSVLASQAQTPAETYPAIERALDLLGDHHSFFRRPEQQQLVPEGKINYAGLRATYPEGIIGIIDPESPAESADVQIGDRIETINGHPVAVLTLEQFRRALGGTQLNLTLRTTAQGSSRPLHLQASSYEVCWLPQGRRLAHDIGYLTLPGLLAGTREQRKAYSKTAQVLIREIDQSATCGWIIDLRCTVGGSMWPMWAGVGPVLGEGEIASFVAPGETFAAVYSGGQVSVKPRGVRGVIDEVEEPYELQRPWPPVAVLTSPLTSSAGEFVALSFRGRPQTRSFGEPTCGVPTANDNKRLHDGAMIVLTTHLGVDRTGQTYESPLLPDHHVTIDWTELGTANDPLLQAAVQWLLPKKAS